MKQKFLTKYKEEFDFLMEDIYNEFQIFEIKQELKESTKKELLDKKIFIKMLHNNCKIINKDTLNNILKENNFPLEEINKIIKEDKFYYLYNNDIEQHIIGKIKYNNYLKYIGTKVHPFTFLNIKGYEINIGYKSRLIYLFPIPIKIVNHDLNEINWKKAAMVGTVAAGLASPLAFDNTKNVNKYDIMSKIDVKPVKEKEYIELYDDNKSTKRPSFAGKYRKNIIEKIIKIAIDNNVDPYIALAVGLAESKFGEEHPNIMQVSDNKGAPTIENGIEILKQAFEDHSNKDLVWRIQAYNGLGKVSGRYYGRNDTIDMSKTPLYGERVIDLTDNVIKQSPEIIKLIKKYSN